MEDLTVCRQPKRTVGERRVRYSCRHYLACEFPALHEARAAGSEDVVLGRAEKVSDFGALWLSAVTQAQPSDNRTCRWFQRAAKRAGRLSRKHLPDGVVFQAKVGMGARETITERPVN